MLLSKTNKCLFYCQPIDMRYSVNSLLAIIINNGLDPKSDIIFGFTSKNRKKVKLIFWNFNGFVLICKHLENRKIQLPKNKNQDKIELNSEDLTLLMAGLEFDLQDELKQLSERKLYS